MGFPFFKSGFVCFMCSMELTRYTFRIITLTRLIKQRGVCVCVFVHGFVCQINKESSGKLFIAMFKLITVQNHDHNTHTRLSRESQLPVKQCTTLPMGVTSFSSV